MKLEPLLELANGDFDKDSLVYFNDNKFYYGPEFPKEILEDIQNHNLQIYHGYYHFNKGWNSPKLYYFGRGKKSGKFKFKVQNFFPYCYNKSEDGEYKSYLGDKVEKILFKKMHPSKVKFFRNRRMQKGYKPPFESDVLFHRRFLIDTYDYFKPKEPIKPIVAILDIETDHPKSDDVIAYSINDQKNSVIYDSRYDTKYHSELTLNLYEHLQDKDVVTGWNINWDIRQLRKEKQNDDDKIWDLIDHHIEYARQGREYTKEEYIKNRFKKLYFSKEETLHLIDLLIERNYLKEEDGIIKLGNKEFNPKIQENIAIIDMLPVSKKMHAQEIRGKWSLGNVGVQMAGIDKVHLGATRIGDLDEDTLRNYNVMDVIIPEIIDNILGGIEAHLILAWSLQVGLDDVMITAVVNDMAMLRAYHRANIVLPTRDYLEKQDEVKYKAAEPDARPGVYEGLIALDLKHAYPSAVISKNISPETKDEKGENIVKYYDRDGNEKIIRFNNDHSVFIDTLKEIMEDRKRVKEKLKDVDKRTIEYRQLKSIDFALKTQAAAFSHGIFGWANSRMRDYEVADAITGVVREIINTVKDACDATEAKWTYVHTDSAYVNSTKEFINGITGYLNDIIRDLCEGDILVPELEFKGYYPKAYIHSPARNVLIPEDGDLNDVDTWNTTGMNYMRSEVAEELADIEIEMIRLKLRGMDNPVLKYRLINRIKNLPKIDSTRLGIIKPLTKPIEKYGRKLKDGTVGGFPYHIKALVRAMNEYGFNVQEGDKFMILPILTDETTGVRKIRRKRIDIAFDIDKGLPDNYDIDYIYYLRSNLFGKIHTLFDLKPKELEKEILTKNVIKILNKEVN